MFNPTHIQLLSNASIPFDSDDSSFLFSPEWSSTIRSIASEASFYGVPALVGLCRTLIEVSDSVQGKRYEKDPNPSYESTSVVDRKDSLAFAIQTLCGIIATPDAIERSQIDESIERLRVSFRLVGESFLEPISFQSNLSKGVVAERVESQHTDTNVYCREKLDPLNSCAEEESWTVTQLATLAEDIATGLSADRCAHRLMQLFRGHKFFHQVNRVCLVLRVADSNQLVVVDACVTPEIRTNGLRRGYSCFVNPSGSLFEMKPGMVRVFGDSSKVIGAFRKQQMPVQRSIALLSDCGLNSGICMALGRGTRIKGFLFFNSVIPNLFKDAAEKYTPLFSLFGLVGTLALDSIEGESSLRKSTWFADEAIPSHSVLFDAKHFENYVNELAETMGYDSAIAFGFPSQQCAFLYLPRLVLSVFYQYLSQTAMFRVKNNPPIVSVYHRERDTYFELRFHHPLCGEKIDVCLQALQRSFGDKFHSWPASVIVDRTGVQLRVPVEPAFSTGLHSDYSIVH